MMDKAKLFLLIVMLALVVSACAPKIYGARPHRRDRHCGCENVPPQTAKSASACIALTDNQ